MAALIFNSFGGEVPRQTKRDLPDAGAQLSRNLSADTLEFRPLNQDAVYDENITGPAINETCRTLYRYPTNSDQIVGTTLELSVVRSTVANDKYDRVYASMMLGQPEANPVILSSGPGIPTQIPGASARPLGVVYPKVAPSLAIGTINDAFLTPWESANFETTLMQKIKNIVSEVLMSEYWNSAFNLTGMPGFREDPNNLGKGQYQRILTISLPLTEASTWNTYNGTPISNHLWAAQVTNPPFIDGVEGRTFYSTFPAKVLVFKLNQTRTAQTQALKDLVLPGTTVRVLTDAEIDLLWSYLDGIIPANPTDTNSVELKTLLTQFATQYTTLVNYLDQGFAADVTPQAGFQLVAKAYTELKATETAILSFYDRLARVDFDNAIISYFREKLPGKVPEGEAEIPELRYYTYTLVNDRMEESRPFLPASGEDLPSIELNQAKFPTITLPANHLTTSGVGPNDFIQYWRLYRSSNGTTSSNFMFVAQIPVAVTSYVDLRLSSALNEVLPTDGWDPPPMIQVGEEDIRYLKHMVGMPGGYMAGFIDNMVYFSEPAHPYAWPAEYSIALQSDVLALGVFGVTLVALTKRGPVYISGSAPGAMSTVVIESNEVCQSPRSVVPVAGGVLFASQNGLCLAAQDGVRVLTERLWTRSEWKSLQPETLACEEMNGVVYISHTGGTATSALHIPTMKLVRLDLSVTAWYSDFHSGDLFAAKPPATGAKPVVIKMLNASGLRKAVWRSKRIVLEKEAGFAWLRAEGEQSLTSPLEIDIFGYYINEAGVEIEVKIATEKATVDHSAVMTDTRPVRIGVGRFKDFEILISGTCRVTSVQLVSSSEELKRIT